MRTPQPLRLYSDQWSEFSVASRPQTQQNSYPQKPQVMWLQPASRIILVLQREHGLTLFLNPKDLVKILSIYALQLRPGWCTSLQLTQTFVLHNLHWTILTLLLAAIIVP